MSASGQAWWISPAMKVPCPASGVDAAVEGTDLVEPLLGVGLVVDVADRVGAERRRPCVTTPSSHGCSPQPVSSDRHHRTPPRLASRCADAAADRRTRPAGGRRCRARRSWRPGWRVRTGWLVVGMASVEGWCGTGSRRWLRTSTTWSSPTPSIAARRRLGPGVLEQHPAVRGDGRASCRRPSGRAGPPRRRCRVRRSSDLPALRVTGSHTVRGPHDPLLARRAVTSVRGPAHGDRPARARRRPAPGC